MVFSVGGVVVNVAQLLLFATAPQPPPLRVDVRSAERRPFRAGCSPSLRRHGWAPPVLNSASSPRPFAGCGEGGGRKRCRPRVFIQRKWTTIVDRRRFYFVLVLEEGGRRFASPPGRERKLSSSFETRSVVDEEKGSAALAKLASDGDAAAHPRVVCSLFGIRTQAGRCVTGSSCFIYEDTRLVLKARWFLCLKRFLIFFESRCSFRSLQARLSLGVHFVPTRVFDPRGTARRSHSPARHGPRLIVLFPSHCAGRLSRE